MTARIRSAAMIEEEAALWLIRREEEDWSVDDQTSLTAWLDQSMAHRAAFWRLEHGWAAADRVAALGPATPTVRAPRSFWRSGTGEITRHLWAQRGGIAASLLAVALVGATWWQLRQPNAPVTAVIAYRTPVGGQRLVRLPDGSRVEMNTATTLRSAVNPGAREVWLDDGEAYFDVVHHADRSFVVHAGPRKITVLGTRFIVRRAGQEVTVAVLSGRVKVENAFVTAKGARSGSAIVTTGDIAVAQPRATLIATDTAHVAAFAAWREGVVVFDNTPLSEAIADLNRYSKQQIRIADPKLADLRIGGTFRTTDGAAFVELMHRAYHVQVRRQGEELLLER